VIQKLILDRLPSIFSLGFTTPFYFYNSFPLTKEVEEPPKSNFKSFNDNLGKSEWFSIGRGLGFLLSLIK